MEFLNSYLTSPKPTFQVASYSLAISTIFRSYQNVKCVSQYFLDMLSYHIKLHMHHSIIFECASLQKPLKMDFVFIKKIPLPLCSDLALISKPVQYFQFEMIIVSAIKYSCIISACFNCSDTLCPTECRATEDVSESDVLLEEKQLNVMRQRPSAAFVPRLAQTPGALFFVSQGQCDPKKGNFCIFLLFTLVHKAI